MPKTISRDELKSRMDEKKPITLIEALPIKYFEDKHLPGAINIPHDEIKQRAAVSLPEKSAFIVTYCASTPCKNSGIAARELESMGYENVYEYVEGKEDWDNAGLPFETGSAQATAA